MYALGYVSKAKENGSGRRLGNFFWLPELGLQITAALTGYKLLIHLSFLLLEFWNFFSYKKKPFHHNGSFS